MVSQVSTGAVSLNHNNFTGSIPTELGNLTNLRYLYLNDNNLSGSIPTELGNLAKLWELSLRNNRLSGSIPSELKGMDALYGIWLQNNQLTGQIPAEFADDDAFGGTSPSLEYVNFTGNQLTDSVTFTVTRTDTNPEQTPPEDMTEDGGAATIEVDVTGLDKGTQWAAGFKTNDETPVDTITARGKIKVSGLGGNRVRFTVNPAGGPDLSIADDENKQEDITFTLTPTNDTTPPG